MIENKTIAREIARLMVDVGAQLNESVAIIQSGCSDAEFQAYRRATRGSSTMIPQDATELNRAGARYTVT